MDTTRIEQALENGLADMIESSECPHCHQKLPKKVRK